LSPPVWNSRGEKKRKGESCEGIYADIYSIPERKKGALLMQGGKGYITMAMEEEEEGR